MSAKTVCTSCLRAMRQQQPRVLQRNITKPITSRAPQHRFISSQPERNPDEYNRRPPTPKDYDRLHDNNPMTNIAASLRNTSALRSTTEPYIAYGSTEDLFLECSRQCSYTIPSALETPPGKPPQNATGDHLGEGSGWWLTPKSKGGLGLEVTFNSWAQVLYLHMWLLTVRLRCFPEKYVKDWHQNLLDHFFYAAEDRMATWHGMAARGVRNKNLKDLWTQWRGVQLAYDEGLIKGDAVMATAVWRNVFKADPNVDVTDLANVTAYVYRELERLGRVGDEMLTEGKVRFGDPRKVGEGVLGRKSQLMQAAQKAEKVEQPPPPENMPS
ncbi:hypothetical protein AC578_1152 [Pseudocercospora eumusae]|uniref:Ubiquinol-cytochrome c chaperone domain-containing protein n=1 Tax=Pseudocercospora eumusae TaxID=321146 RepID=A0A139HJM3_9PEZI|nr:hypothetical protein AC578_1152 [Pseudocercospora eumusae]